MMVIHQNDVKTFSNKFLNLPIRRQTEKEKVSFFGTKKRKKIIFFLGIKNIINFYELYLKTTLLGKPLKKIVLS